MAITRGAKKAIRTHARKRVFNVRRKVILHDAVHTLRTHIQNNAKKEALAHLPTVYQALDKSAKRGTIKPNTASRTKSRLTKAVLKLK